MTPSLRSAATPTVTPCSPPRPTADIVVQAARSDASVGPTTVGVHDTTSGTLRFAPITVDGVVTSAVFLPRPRPSRPDDRRGGPPARRRRRRRDAAHVGRPVCPCREDDIIWTLEPEAGADGQVLRRPARRRRRRDAPCSSARRRIAPPVRRLDDRAATDDHHRRQHPRQPPTARRTARSVTSGRFGLGRIDLTTGRRCGSSSEQETCVNVTVAEQRGVFYCGDPYGRLARARPGDRGACCAASTPRTATPARCGPPATAPSSSASAPSSRSSPAGDSTAQDRSPASSPRGGGRYAFNHTSDRLLIETGHVLDGDYAAQVIDAESGDVVARPDGLIVPGWNERRHAVGRHSRRHRRRDRDRRVRPRPTGRLTSFGNGIPLAEALTIAGQRPRHRQGAHPLPLPGRHRQLARPVRQRHPQPRAAHPRRRSRVVGDQPHR